MTKTVRVGYLAAALRMIVGAHSQAGAQTPGAPTGLQCDALVEPLGIDTAKPMLAWKLADPRPGAKQTAYEITVGNAPGKSDVWDSGRVASAQSTGVAYAGPALTPSRARSSGATA